MTATPEAMKVLDLPASPLYWLRGSAMHGNRRWLVKCDPLDGGNLDAHRVEMGTLVPACVEDLLRES